MSPPLDSTRRVCFCHNDTCHLELIRPFAGAWAIVQLLKKLARHFSILCTIHQPSGELFNQFDRLLLLQKGGEVVYQGDLGENCSTVLGYFEHQSGTKMAQGANPAEWILEVRLPPITIHQP